MLHVRNQIWPAVWGSRVENFCFFPKKLRDILKKIQLAFFFNLLGKKTGNSFLKTNFLVAMMNGDTI